MPSIKEKTARNKWPLAGGLALGLLAVVAALAWRGSNSSTQASPRVVHGDGVIASKDMVWVPAGTFLMGSDSKLAQANERPAHKVRVGGFWMDVAHVTNDDFARFVEQTGYITTAERKPDWETIRVQLPPGIPRPPDDVLVPGAMVFVGTSGPVHLDDYSQWWRYVPDRKSVV